MRHWRQPRRRAAWLAGRLAARRLIDRRRAAAPDRESVEILSLGERGVGIRPVARGRGGPLPWSLSITHAEDCVCVALAGCESWEIGIDLVAEQPGRARRLEVWFTPHELDLIRRQADWTADHIWAAKEAAYKACQRGERFAPRQIEIEALAFPWLRGTCRFAAAVVTCDIYCQRLPRHVLAVAALPRHRDRENPLWPALPTGQQTPQQFPRLEWMEE
jgi:phosphopantetheinyl transferase